MRPGLASDLYDVLRSVDAGPNTEMTDQLLARTAGRGLEEFVELALECGLSSSQVMQHVADAIHNECRKHGCYPSELPAARGSRDALVLELGDTGQIHEYIRHIAGITTEEVDAAAEAKLAKLKQHAEAGTLKVSNGLMYINRAK